MTQRCKQTMHKPDSQINNQPCHSASNSLLPPISMPSLKSCPTSMILDNFGTPKHQELTAWFMGLFPEQLRAVTTIEQQHFIRDLLEGKYLQSYNGSLTQDSWFQKNILQNLRVACSENLLIYFETFSITPAQLLSWIFQTNIPEKVDSLENQIAEQLYKSLCRNFHSISQSFQSLMSFKKYLKNQGQYVNVQFLEIPLQKIQNIKSEWKKKQILLTENQICFKTLTPSSLKHHYSEKKDQLHRQKWSRFQMDRSSRSPSIRKNLMAEFDREKIQSIHKKSSSSTNRTLKKYDWNKSQKQQLTISSNESTEIFEQGKKNQRVKSLDYWRKFQTRLFNFREQEQTISIQLKQLSSSNLTEKATYLSEVDKVQDNFEQDEVLTRKPRKNYHQASNNCPYRRAAEQLYPKILTASFTDFVDEISNQSNELMASKIECFTRIEYILTTWIPQVETILYGSNAIGIALPSSDLDIMIYNIPCLSEDQSKTLLKTISDELNKLNWVCKCTPFLTAKIPLLKLQVDPAKDPYELKHSSSSNHCGTLKVDITVSLEGKEHVGILATKAMKHYLEPNPELQRQIIAFKYLLSLKGLNQNFKGGLGSYCLFLLINSYLTQYNITDLENQGEIFLKTLQFLGEQLDNRSKTVYFNSESSCFIDLEDSYKYSDLPQEVISRNQLRIVDPINGKMITSSFHHFNLIKREFSRVARELTKEKGLIEEYLRNQYPSEAHLEKMVKHCSQEMIESYINTHPNLFGKHFSAG